MNDWKIIPTIMLATALIFGAGVFSGGMLVDYVKQSHPHSANPKHPAQSPSPTPATNVPAVNPPATNVPAKPPKPPELLSKELLQRLDTELHLNKDQHEAVQKIINESQNEMRKVLQDARLEIRDVLTPEQCQQFDELMKRPFRKPLFNTNTPPTVSTSAPPASAANTNKP